MDDKIEIFAKAMFEKQNDVLHKDQWCNLAEKAKEHYRMHAKNGFEALEAFG